ncbi:MAG: hypothetical protein ACF8MF_10505 [Phycisphaerales bacterium JB052]
MRTCIMLVIAALLTRAAQAQSTFTYQGELQENAQPANGTYDLRFEIYDSQTGGVPLDSISQAVNITDGIFSVELTTNDTLESDRWLEIAVILTPDASQIQIISPRQKITEAPRASYSIRTRGIHVDAQERVGVGTASPGVALEVVQNPNDVQVFRLTDMLQQFQLRFRVALRNTLIQAWNLGSDAPETLYLNPMGGLTTLGPSGLAFNDGTVQTTAGLRVIATASDSGSAQGGESTTDFVSVPGTLPGDLVLITGGAVGNEVIPHSPVALTDEVRVTITNASNNFNFASTNYTVTVLRP